MVVVKVGRQETPCIQNRYHGKGQKPEIPTSRPTSLSLVEENLKTQNNRHGKIHQKGPYAFHKLLDKVNKANESSKRALSRPGQGAMIIPNMVGPPIAVHNGKSFIPVFVTEKYGWPVKLGEFAPTRTFKGHSGNR